MPVGVVIVGLGNVGRRLLEIMVAKRELIKRRFGLEFEVRGLADSSGGCRLAGPEELERALAVRAAGGKLADAGPVLDPASLLDPKIADLLVELTPTNLKTGEPGLSLIRAALAKRINVVTANKGPMVLAFQELASAAERQGARLLYSATVTGGLPTLNIGRRDLGACEFLGFEGVVNATTNYILTRMSEGESFEAALRHAQAVGHAEADPSLDIDGWDAANKLVIIANAVLRRPTRLSDLEVTGIRGVTQEQLDAAKRAGRVIKLVARAEKVDGDFRLSVRPTALDKNHPLVHVGAERMGIIYHTDINGDILAMIEERDPYPTAAAVLRDMINACAT